MPKQRSKILLARISWHVSSLSGADVLRKSRNLVPGPLPVVVPQARVSRHTDFRFIDRMLYHPSAQIKYSGKINVMTFFCRLTHLADKTPNKNWRSTNQN